MILDRRNLLAGAGAMLLSPTRPGRADTFPTRPLTLIVPLAAGSSVDVILRVLAAAAEKRLGQPIVVENKPGAGTTLGPSQMAAAAKGSDVGALLDQMAQQLPQAAEQVRAGPLAAKQMKTMFNQLPLMIETMLTWFEPPKP